MKQSHDSTGYFKRFQTFVINRMGPPSAPDKDSLLYWRARILFAILLTGWVLSFFLIIPIIPFLIQQRLWGLALMDGAALVILPGLVFCRLGYRIRAVITLLLAYTIGVGVILSVGPLSGGPIWLFAFAVLTGVLLGSKETIVALCMNALTLTIIGWLMSTGRLGHTFPFFSTSQAMLVTGANFMFLNAVTAISVTVLVKGLVAIHQKEKGVSTALGAERSHLVEAKKQLEQEVEEHRQTEDTLRKSEEKYRALVELTSEGYTLLDRERKIVDVNEAFCRMLGYEKNDIIGKTPLDLTDDKNRKIFAEQMGKIPTTLHRSYEITLKKKNNDDLHAYFNATTLRDKTGNVQGSFALATDMTERKKAEAERNRLAVAIEQAQKMEAIATLAGGIAHQFNNALAVITGHTGLLEMQRPEDETVIEYVGAMKQSADRMAHLTRQLLAYARGGKYSAHPMSLSDFVVATLPMIEPHMNSGIRIETDLPLDLLEVNGDQTQMQMVLSAILNNSNEAIEGSGRIKISTRNVTLDPAFVKDVPELKPGAYVSLCVEDDGEGMDEETKNRVFDPFFTTHFMGRGLGMAAVYGIVRNHDGWISVDSTPGKGTIVRIYLPVISGEGRAQ